MQQPGGGNYPRAYMGSAADNLPPRAGRHALPLQGVLVALVALVVGAWIQINPGYVTNQGQSQWMWQRSQGLPPGDGYYHIRMACLYRTGEVQAAGANFHWTRESIWNGSFSDKDYLYHIGLIPFTLVAQDGRDYDGLIRAAKLSACFGGMLVALALWAALALLRVPRPWLWVALLAVAGGRLFLARASEPRSWVLGVAFSLLGYALLARRKRAWLVVVSAAYVLSYTGAHLLPAFAVFRLAAAVLRPPLGETRAVALKHEALSLLAVIAGFCAGWLLHPNSLELARLWWVQNLLVPQAATRGYVPEILRGATAWVLGWPSGTPQPSLMVSLFGLEMRAPAPERVALDFWYAFVAPVALAGASLALRAKPGREAVLATIVAAGFTVLMLRHERFAEYAAPYWVLATAIWVAGLATTTRWQGWMQAGPKLRTGLRLALPGVLAVLTCVQTARAGDALGFQAPGVFRDAGQWMADHDELRGAVIYNHSWDAFSELFFYRPDADYMAGLDPMFVAAKGTENSRKWLLLMQNRTPEVAKDPADLVRVLRDDFDADYLFVHRLTSDRFFALTLQMAEARQLEPVVDRRQQGYMLYRIPQQ